MREWERVNAGESRVPEKAVLAFLDRLEAERCLMHGFAMLDEGKMLAEGYWAPFTAKSLHRMYSAGKSFVSLAIGLLREEGKLSLDDEICRYFPDKCPDEALHPWIAGTTIRQMLTMTTCHSRTTYKRYEGDWVESFFRVEPDHLPGAVFSYDTSSAHVLSALAERLSGRKLMDYLRKKCFDKIGVSKEAYFLCDPAGVSQGGSGLNCTLRDLLAVAELVLDGGMYRGERLLDAAYLKEAAAAQVPTLYQPAFDEQFGYGYQIWRGRHDSFYFYGIGGQLAVCLPKERFILVTMGNTLDNKNGIKDIFDAFFGEIYPWLEGKPGRGQAGEQGACGEVFGRSREVCGGEVFGRSREACGGEVFGRSREACGGEVCENSLLARRLSGLSLAEPLRVPGEACAGYRDAFWQGRWYFFTENRLKISRMCVTFDGREGELYLEKEGREFRLAFGAEACVRRRFPWPVCGAAEPECCCQGIFLQEDMVLLRCHILGPEMARLTIVLRFLEEGVTVKFQKGAEDSLKNFDGCASGLPVPVQA